MHEFLSRDTVLVASALATLFSLFLLAALTAANSRKRAKAFFRRQEELSSRFHSGRPLNVFDGVGDAVDGLASLAFGVFALQLFAVAPSLLVFLGSIVVHVIAWAK